MKGGDAYCICKTKNKDGRVYVGDLDGDCLVDYCAASFPKFKMIMEAYQEAVETTPYPEEADWEGFEEHCERAEQVLWQQLLEEEFEECRKNAEEFCGKWLWT